MRQRITYLQEPNDSIDPKTLEVGESHIRTKGLKAAREEKITFAFDELPRELHEVLKKSHEVHVRWVSETAYESQVPVVSRLSPGLHVFYTPQRGRKGPDLLCPMLKKVFGNIDCVSPELSFTSLPTERFSHSAALQYHTPLPSLTSFTSYLTHKLCPSRSASTSSPAIHATCLSRVQTLSHASTVDINFDTISHALVLSAFSPPSIHDLHLENHAPGASRLEVGILSVEKPVRQEELSLGGFLTVVGEDTKASPTLFSFPARHHPLPASSTFSSHFLTPSGLHPTLKLSVSTSAPPLGDRACKMHAYLVLPKEVFADKYQLSDPLFLASKNLSALHYISNPVDLEAPAYTVPLWGSSVLLELSPPPRSHEPSPDTELREWTAQIPLHLRYLSPNTGHSGLANLSVPYPAVFWACTADEGSKFPINPFDRVNLGYDGLFGPRTLFYHLSPKPWEEGANARLVSKLSVPVLDLEGAEKWYVRTGTAAVITVGFAWIVWRLWRVWQMGGWQSHRDARKVSEKKKR